MVVKNDRKSSYFKELPPVGAPPSFLPSASVSQPKGNHNEEAYVIFDKSTTLFPKGGLSPIFFLFLNEEEKFLRAKFASLKTGILNFFWCKPWILIIPSYFKILGGLPEVRPPFLGFVTLFWLLKKDRKRCVLSEKSPEIFMDSSPLPATKFPWGTKRKVFFEHLLGYPLIPALRAFYFYVPRPKGCISFMIEFLQKSYFFSSLEIYYFNCKYFSNG